MTVESMTKAQLGLPHFDVAPLTAAVKATVRPKHDNLDILILDIETAPHLAYVWKFWKENIGHSQVKQHGYVMSVAAKWLGEDKVDYVEARKPKNERAMLEKVWKWLDKAQFVVAHNGRKFDIPTLNSAFVRNGLPPPSPYTVIDTLDLAKKHFRFPRNSLEALAEFLGCTPKSKHRKFFGFELWAECVAGNKEAWLEMREYNPQDVRTLEEVYLKLRAWHRTHPHVGRHGDTCRVCGSDDLRREGKRKLASGLEYPRYVCRQCHSWTRGTTPLNRGEKRYASIGN